MGTYNEVLVTLLLLFGVILLIFLIILSIKLLYSAEKLNIILADLEKKMKSVSGIFNVIDETTDAISKISDTIIEKVIQLVEKIFIKKRKGEEKDE